MQWTELVSHIMPTWKQPYFNTLYFNISATFAKIFISKSKASLELQILVSKTFISEESKFVSMFNPMTYVRRVFKTRIPLKVFKDPLAVKFINDTFWLYI